MKIKTCSFIGHRKIDLSEEVIEKINEIIEDLIVNFDVRTFLFGSKSMFDNLCYEIVTCLKEKKYSFIKRIFYSSRSEACYLEKDRKGWEEFYLKLNKNVKFYGYEENFEHKTKFTAGKAGYVERNRAMIDDSDYCVFFYEENYLPEMRKQTKKSLNYYQPKSGTAIAYAYAKQKKKNIINVNQL